MKSNPPTKKTLYALIIIFILLVAYFLITPELKNPLFPLLAILGLAFMVMGVTLVFISRKEKGPLKLFLTITGLSAVAPLLFSILHNVFYGLGFETLHATFFIISILIAPITFIIGVIGSIILFRREQHPASKH